ncbi:MAG TPA: sigma-70 family RNA polymerase sigma factor [Acidimicrobiales bacterium]|nr:sigma-70 family RNA polymerase sigma factor [Acidimicrobiales bacterium]
MTMEAVVGEAPAGACEGFERFFRAQYPTVVRIARGVVRDPHLAEDVAQDVMIAARRRFSDPEGSDHAVAWVRTAAAHLALNAVRGSRRREARHLRARPERASAGPEEILLDREAGAEVRAALAGLPVRSAMVLVLRHSGLSYAEVADTLGVGVGAVGTMLRRAEAALRREVEKHAPRS